MSEFTVFLVDDDQAMLRSLERFLQAAGYPIRAYSSAKLFLEEFDSSTPGCVVLGDFATPKFNGLSMQDSLIRRRITRPIIFLTGRGTIPESVRAMRAGAVDFLTKPANESDFLSAIKRAEEQDKASRGNEGHRKEVLRKMASLSPREREILDHLMTGSLNKQIAAAAGVQEKTVKVHRARIFKKMGVRNIAELMRMMLGLSRQSEA